MAFLNIKYNAFGLDINDSSVKIIKLEKRGGNFCVNSFNDAEIKPGVVEDGVIQDEKSLVKIIKSACEKVKRKKLGTKYVIASLPESESFLQVIQMPKMSYDELKSAVCFEAENYIPLPIDQVYLGAQVIIPLKDSLDHMDVLVSATPKRIVDSYVSCLKSAGLIPIILEMDSQSIVRSVIKDDVSEYPVVVLDLGEDKTDFIVFCGRSIRFTYSIPRSQKARGQDMTGPFLRELISQIKKYVDFYHEHASHEHLFVPSCIKKIILSGDGANTKGFQEFLAEQLNIQTEIADPFVNLQMAKKSKEDFSKFLSFTAALGLAIRGVNIKDEDIND